jgi:hypothetical protein
MEDERIPKRFLMGNFTIQEQWENKNKMAGCHLEGHITDRRNTRMKTRRRQRRINASSEGRQGPEGCSTIDG